MADDKAQEKQPYDETVESAKLFKDIEQSRAEQPSKSQGDVKAAAPSEEAVKPLERKSPERPSPEEQAKAAETSVGELFSNLVKMSPQEKIRIEDNSIGSLFKKYISKRG